MIALGWVLDTFRPMVLLPNDEFVAWDGDITTMIQEGLLTVQELESKRDR